MSQLLFALASVSLLQFGGIERAEVIEALSTALADRYLYEDVGKRLAADLRARLARGEFDSLSDHEAFAAAVTDVLQREMRDRHVWIWYRQGAVAPVQFSSVEGPMIARAQMLPGKIGYLDIRHFVGMTSELDAAMAAVKDSAALMIDLRSCVGGNAETVQHLATYFFAKRTHILSQVTRASSKPIERWMLDEVPGQRVPDIPVYILTSRRTFSAAESFTVALRGLVLLQGMTPVIAGLGAGLLASAAIGRLIESMLFGVSSRDVMTYATVTTMIVAGPLAACLIPARRAASIDATVALRAE